MKKHHEVSNVKVVAGRLFMTVDGNEYVVELAKVSARLAHATIQDQQRLEVSASGYGIHWPTVDEDLSVDGLIRTSKAARRKTQTRRKVTAK
jgi:hypothetical protein